MCGLGQTASNPVLSTLRYFREEYEAHIKDKKCPARVCKELIQYFIDYKEPEHSLTFSKIGLGRNLRKMIAKKPNKFKNIIIKFLEIESLHIYLSHIFDGFREAIRENKVGKITYELEIDGKYHTYTTEITIDPPKKNNNEELDLPVSTIIIGFIIILVVGYMIFTQIRHRRR